MSLIRKSIFTNSDLDVCSLSDAGYTTIKDTLIQLNRNVLVHGIEAPELRAKAGKLERGAVTVLFNKMDSTDNVTGEAAYQLKVRDDGAGLNLDKILSKAIELKLTTKEKAKKLTKSEIVKFIFEPEFSTAEDLSSHAGRGVGLDIIKNTIVNSLGGKLSISFAKGAYMQISCIIPANKLEEQAAKISA